MTLLDMQADPNADVRGRMINAGIMVIDKHGRENVSLLFPIFENYLNKKVSSVYQKFDYKLCPEPCGVFPFVAPLLYSSIPFMKYL